MNGAAMSGTSKTITVSPERKAKVLRDAARNSKVKVVRLTPGQRAAAAGTKSA